MQSCGQKAPALSAFFIGSYLLRGFPRGIKVFCILTDQEYTFSLHIPTPLRVYTKLNINCLRVCVGHELPVHGGVQGDGEQAQGTAVLKSYLCY